MQTLHQADKKRYAAREARLQQLYTTPAFAAGMEIYQQQMSRYGN